MLTVSPSVLMILTETVSLVTRARRRGKPRSPKVDYQWFECWNISSQFSSEERQLQL